MVACHEGIDCPNTASYTYCTDHMKSHDAKIKEAAITRLDPSKHKGTQIYCDTCLEAEVQKRALQLLEGRYGVTV